MTVARMAALAVAIVAASGCAALGRRADRGDLPYFFKVDDRVYRGAHPTPEGLRRLSEMGVKTIVNLRGEDPRFQGHDRAVAELYGMRWVYLPMHAFWRPTDTQIREFLTLALDPSTSPIFLHCRQGEDRTGTLVAIYRVVGQGWEPAKAYQEARRMGLSWWNPLLRWVVLEEAPKRYAPMFPRPPERGE